ncbi:E3 ubiquitin-protein ligase MBR1-like [Magnolia sinica]|uniref:E3 ubiquitin-protein ligase MBR1-like n=1 Tax=Magnolia sinica TaxID=86752 RepID=UPI00265ADDD1|nr:E3 ubiquitin-protein ligase MBR1-like [Magnolia sinica]
MARDHTISCKISGQIKKSNETQEPIAAIEIRLKKKHRRLLDLSGHDLTFTVATDTEILNITKSLSVEMSSLLIPQNLQLFIPTMLSDLELCSCALGNLKESIAVSLRSIAEEVVRRGRYSLQVVLEIEHLTSSFYFEDEVIHQATTDSMDINGDSGRFGGTPASRSSIEEALRTEKVEERDWMENCRICLDEFGEGMEVKRMPCSHVFHGACITRWLKQSNMCPLCRVRV